MKVYLAVGKNFKIPSRGSFECLFNSEIPQTLKFLNSFQ